MKRNKKHSLKIALNLCCFIAVHFSRSDDQATVVCVFELRFPCRRVVITVCFLLSWVFITGFQKRHRLNVFHAIKTSRPQILTPLNLALQKFRSIQTPLLPQSSAIILPPLFPLVLQGKKRHGLPSPPAPHSPSSTPIPYTSGLAICFVYVEFAVHNYDLLPVLRRPLPVNRPRYT